LVEPNELPISHTQIKIKINVQDYFFVYYITYKIMIDTLSKNKKDYHRYLMEKVHEKEIKFDILFMPLKRL